MFWLWFSLFCILGMGKYLGFLIVCWLGRILAKLRGRLLGNCKNSMGNCKPMGI